MVRRPASGYRARRPRRLDPMDLSAPKPRTDQASKLRDLCLADFEGKGFKEVCVTGRPGGRPASGADPRPARLGAIGSRPVGGLADHDERGPRRRWPRRTAVRGRQPGLRDAGRSQGAMVAAEPRLGPRNGPADHPGAGGTAGDRGPRLHDRSRRLDRPHAMVGAIREGNSRRRGGWRSASPARRFG